MPKEKLEFLTLLLYWIMEKCVIKSIPVKKPKSKALKKLGFRWVPHKQSVCIVPHTVCIRKSTCCIKVTCNPQINTCGAFVVISRHTQDGEKFELSHTHTPSWGQKGRILPSFFSSHTINKGAFSGLFSAVLLHFCAFCWRFPCLQWSQVPYWVAT